MPPTIAQLAGWLVNPAIAGAGAAAVAIPIAIHLLTRLRREQVHWAAMRFLNQAFRKHKQRLRLEQWLLLLVRCLILLLLGLALGQPLLDWWAAGASGRTVHLVLDDSLSTRADEGGRARFERLRETALSIVDQMQVGDQLAIWRGARPARAAQKPSPFDAARARQLIASIKPRYSRSDLTEALSMIAAQEQDAGAQPQVVIVLSDFAASTLDLEQRAPEAVAQLAGRAKLLVARPAQPAPNVQVQSVTPRRRTVVVDQVAGRAVAVEVKLRRFADDRDTPLTRLRVRLLDGDTVVSELKRDHRWAAGQDTAAFNFELPTTPKQDDDPAQRAAQWHATIEASILSTGSGDVMEADNRRWSVALLRRRLMVAMVGDVAGRTDRTELAPRDWVSLALAPRRDDDLNPGVGVDSMELYSVDAGRVDDAALSTLDAVLVLRPDRLTAEATAALGRFARRGGLLWIMPPAADLPLTWAAPLLEQLQLDWRVALEPIEFDAPGEPLAVGGAAPEALSLLGADWASLLGPVRVRKAMQVEPGAGSDATWLATSTGRPLMLVARCGEGDVVMLTTAISDAWTDLPTKPLFVPLLHETLRSLIGRRGDGAVLAGAKPALGRSWAQVRQLARGRGAEVAVVGAPEARTTARALDEPGVYSAKPAGASGAGAGAGRLAVNVDADGGDLRAIDGDQLVAWLGAQWLDQASPASALRIEQEQTNIGWQLLWAVLVLVLLETALARWFSHAARLRATARTQITRRAA